ncbi:MAG: caspase family protein [Aquamicrobium sp.]|uniref:caspase family protein n=1 Tax=Aquamicrobium sp. TaxID=1872579 RepID=UPI00349EB7E4|nr:caspase family protein [Aquamicrobium sp.]
MRRFRWVVLIACLAAAPHAAMAEKRVALVFAAQDYETIRPLANPRNDARLIERALEKLGFEVSSESDRDLRRMRRALENFVDDAEGADVAFVYFAGHGVEIGGHNHLLPVDADATSLDRLKETSLPLEEVRAAVAAAARSVLIVLDACRNDPFGAASLAPDGRGAVSLAPDVEKSARPGLGRVGRAENTLFAFSAAPGETAADGAGENSPFAAALAGFLDTDGLEIRSVLTLVQQQVYDETGGRQLPYVESGLPSLFFASRSGDLPEREALLLAMADITAGMRAEVEMIAAAGDMPLAPLYGALISADLKALSAQDRTAKLEEAAAAYGKARADLRTLSASDPEVARLRSEAEAQMGLGAFDRARAILAEAVSIDAESADALAEKLVSRRVSEAASLKAAAGVSLAQLDYAAALDAYEKAAGLHLKIENEAVPDADRRARTWLLADLGDLQAQLGSTTAALDAYRRMEASARLRMTQGEGGDDAIRDLGLAMLRVSDVLRTQGDIAGAEALLDENLKMRGAQRARMEGNADWLTSVSNITERIGDIRRQRQDLDGALSYYDATLSFREWLVEHYADRPENRDGLLSILGRIGSVRYDKADFAGAAAIWARRLDEARRFAADFPGEVPASIRLFDALLSVGDAALAEGDGDRALAAYDEAAAGARALIARDGRQVRLHYALAQSLKGAGWAHLARRDRPAAYAAFDEARAVMDGLTAQDPRNVQWRLYRARIMSDIGTARYQAGEYDKAIAVLERSVEDLGALAAGPAADRDIRLALMRALLDLGRSRRLIDDNAKARDAYAGAAGIGRQLDLVNSQDSALRANFEAALYNLGVLCEMLGGREEAAAAFSELAALVRDRDARQPGPDTRRRLLDLTVKIARLSADPRPHYEAALELAERLEAASELGEYDATPAQLREQLARLP